MTKGIPALAAALLLLPASAFAATYSYVDSNGFDRTVEANSAAEALASAPNIALHSGVQLMTGSTIASGGSVLGASTEAGLETYSYVDANGLNRTVQASSPAEALAIAPNIAIHSGVQLMP